MDRLHNLETTMTIHTKKGRVALWILQAVLCGLFLFAGGFKLVLPLATLAKFSPLPPLFFKFIGLCEFAGGLGLVLPGIFRIRENVTTLAAVGLAGVMAGAVTMSVALMGVGSAIMPFVVGLLLIAIVRGRTVRLQTSY
ncbi:MAG TPA: DoxX family protein [Gemmatimonadales bacterium]|nr:DoxX family protein [Gemmatimonadales bacterium]